MFGFRRAAWRLLATLIVVSRVAHGGNDDELIVGNRASMTGGAAVATADDGSAVWYNPAGLGGIGRTTVDVSGTVYTLRFYSTDELLSTTTGASTGANVTEFVSIPTQIAFTRPLGEKVTLGLGYFVPRTSNIVLREQLAVGSEANGGEWQVALSAATAEQVLGAAIGAELR